MKVRRGVIETMLRYMDARAASVDKVLCCLRCEKIVPEKHGADTGHWNFIVEATAEELEKVRGRIKRRKKK